MRPPPPLSLVPAAAITTNTSPPRAPPTPTESQLALALSTGALAAAIRAQDGYGPPPGEASKALKALVDARRAGLVREGAVTLGGRAWACACVMPASA